MKSRFSISCCCPGGTPPPPPDTVPCLGCNVPTTLTLTWYWCGFNESPCLTPIVGGYDVHGPRTDTLTYDMTSGRWISTWNRSPCWNGSNPFGGGGPPFGCLYHRFTWDCVTTLMFVDFSDTAAGTNVNACLAGIARQGTADILGARRCTPFFAMFPSTAPGACGSAMFAGGVLTP